MQMAICTCIFKVILNIKKCTFPLIHKRLSPDFIFVIGYQCFCIYSCSAIKNLNFKYSFVYIDYRKILISKKSPPPKKIKVYMPVNFKIKPLSLGL